MTGRPFADRTSPPRGTEAIPRGALVEDPDSGRVGILQDVTAYVPPWRGDRRPRLLAFVRPVGGGREWTAPPDRLRPVLVRPDGPPP
ncbi:hypothetical protein M4914_07320 [Streptomyces somaliensis DSM 40738]|uniref:Uncharacterized protein n=1 Tax=Streptomyces somaliensis (strain ATCC 33201 / DSM 40738 / JCM 12659 / KCTC 9044 / NCTC 11332 / NRRL B-12077 / IP 733) TaxID=1134445 RepID=A0AA44IDE5_STRE0|nr:hypothetical protein [Streptomyces somaliensis]MCQ0022779.1 hypothetical protein [Streptomyces somaliensis DSM 40738]NKY14635.1 hypothetical protein [Streptomyces somaliensis DSM 40738]